MLWFSIPAVILLASIPVLVIVSQTEDFSMLKYFDSGEWIIHIQYIGPMYFAFTKPFGWGFWICLMCFMFTAFFIMDAKGEWK